MGALLEKTDSGFRSYGEKKKSRFRHSRGNKSGILPNFDLKVFFSSLLSMAENMGNI